MPTSVFTSSEGILEDLLEAQEFENREVDRWVEAETALEGTKGRIELYTKPAIDLNLRLIVLPYYSELNNALGHGRNGQSFLVLGMLLEQSRVLEGRGKFCLTVSRIEVDQLKKRNSLPILCSRK